MASSDAPEAASASVTTSTRRVRVVVVRPDERVEQVVARFPGAVPSFNRTLRIALAMRGGVSLAVWIGGAVAELDLLRRIRLYDDHTDTLALVPETPDSPLTPAVHARVQAYAEMLDSSGYDRVEFDLLAGASAGGLNAVVYAVAQRAGTGLESLLKTWGRVGGFWGLLHPPGSRRILALMQGEGYFRTQTLDALTKIYETDDRHPDLVSEYTSVDLSATVIDASDEFEEDAHEGRGHFRFVGSDEHRFDNRIPRRLDELDETGRLDDLANLSRLALAARSTSSLPGGFEPAHIDSFSGLAGEPDVAEERGMRFAFAAHREQAGTPYRIVDGAVFDNVPIDRALRAARSRTSDRKADRVMLFLDPEPDPPIGGAFTWDEHASRFFRAIGAMLSRQLRRESVAREVADLERFNAERSAAAARFDSAAPLVATAPWSQPAIAERRAAYVRGLGTTLAEHLAETLSAPSVWQLHSTLPTRRRYRPLERIALAGLGPACARRFAELSSSDAAAVARSPLALIDAANCVLGWTRALESLPEEEGSRRGLALPEARRTGYDALTAAIHWRDELTAAVLLQSDRLAARGVLPTTADYDDWIDEWLRASARVKTAEHWRDLDMSVARLRIMSAGFERDAGARRRTLPTAWTTSGWRPLGSAPGSLAAADLPPLYHASGIPAALSHVQYWAIGVDEEPDDPASFRTLAADRWYAALGRAMRRPRTTPDEVAAAVNAASDRVVIDRQSKLAGYGFGNFLGFLAREWRVNDWWWGRLDAAAGIARFFTSLAPAEVRTGPAIRLLQDAVLEEADSPGVVADGLSPLEAATAAADDAGRRTTRRVRLRAGTDTIVNLRPSYRFAIASRAVRLLDRVIVQPLNRGIAALAGAVLALLRPVLVALPTVADPPRLALVAGFVAAVAWLLTWSPVRPPSAGWIAATTIITLGLAVMIVGGVWSARRRWSAVAEALDLPLDDFARNAAQRAWRPTLRLMLLTLASLVPLALSLVQTNVLLVLLCLGVTAVLTAITLRVASSAQRTRIPGRDVRTALMIATFAALGGLLPLVQLVFATPGGWLSPPSSWNPWVLAAGAAAVTIALTADWLRFGRRLAEIKLTRGIDWITVTVLSVATGLGGYAVVWALTAGVAPLIAENLCAAAFIVAWANALWWLPELAKATPEVVDRVDRSPLAAADLRTGMQAGARSADAEASEAPRNA
jgi:predicted acylesterase/phospholipase RssA